MYLAPLWRLREGMANQYREVCRESTHGLEAGYQQLTEYRDRAQRHPIQTLFRLIADRTGVHTWVIEDAVRRLSANQFLPPAERLRGGAEQGSTDLRWVLEAMKECDATGITRGILGEFAARHPGILPDALLPRETTPRPPAVSGNEDRGIRRPKVEAADPLSCLTPSRRKAYGQYLDALQRNPEFGDKPTDKAIYDWLLEHQELGDEPMPSRATWYRYLREARAACGQQKHTRRTGRPTGNSVIREADN
jgi:hypothetical protein